MFEEIIMQLSKSVRAKGHKFVSKGCVVSTGNDMWLVKHIEGYNKTDYLVKKNPEGWSCDCQAGKKGKTCSHITSVWIFLG